MEPWEHDRLFNTTHSIDAPDEIPEYDPYYDDEYRVDCYLNDEARLEAQISNWLGMEVRL